MSDYKIVEVQLPVAVGIGGHNFLALIDPNGNVLGEIDGLATGTNGQIKTIGYSSSDTLNTYTWLNGVGQQAANQNLQGFYKSSYAQVTLASSNSISGVQNDWNAALACTTALNSTSRPYPFFGLGENSNSVASTLITCMGLAEPNIPGGSALTPGSGSILLNNSVINNIQTQYGISQSTAPSSRLINSETAQTNADGSITTTTTFMDGSKNVETNSGGALQETNYLSNGVVQSSANTSSNGSGQISAAIAGQGYTVDLSNASISLAAGAQAALSAANNAVTLAANATLTLGTGATGNTVDANGNGDTVNVSGAGASVGSGLVTVAGPEEKVSFSTFAAVTVEPGDTATITGTDGTMTAHDNTSSFSNTINWSGGGSKQENFTPGSGGASSEQDFGYSGANDTGTQLYTQSTTTTSGGSISSTITGTGDSTWLGNASITLSSGAQAVIDGNNDSINGGSSNTIGLGTGASNDTIFGSGNIINGSAGTIFGVAGGNDTVNAGGATVYMDSGSSGATVYGSNAVINGNASSGILFGVAGANDSVNGTGATVYFDTGSSGGTVFGNNNILDANATGLIFGLTGTNDSINAGHDTVYMDAGEMGGTVYGNNNVVDAAKSTMFGVSGSWDTLNTNGDIAYVDSGTQNTTIFGGQTTINQAGGLTIGVAGPQDLVNTASSTVLMDPGGAAMLVSGSHDHVTVADNQTLIITGNNEVVQGGANDHFVVTGNYDIISGATSDTVFYASGDQSDMFGGSMFGNAGGSGPSGDFGDEDDGGGGYNFGGGFGFTRSVTNAGSDIATIAKFDTANAPKAFPTAGAVEAAHAAWMEAAQALGAGGNFTQGAMWNTKTVTWSMATAAGPASKDAPFSSYMGKAEEALLQKAFDAWGKASGITFQEVADSSASDIRVGWGDFNTQASGVAGYTSYKTSYGLFSPGVVIRLEDPSKNALTADASGDKAYAGTSADLYQLMLHEIGHAIGLSDTADTTSTMYAVDNGSVLGLSANDVAAAQSLYSSAPDAGIASYFAAAQSGASQATLGAMFNQLMQEPTLTGAPSSALHPEPLLAAGH